MIIYIEKNKSALEWSRPSGYVPQFENQSSKVRKICGVTIKNQARKSVLKENVEWMLLRKFKKVC